MYLCSLIKNNFAKVGKDEYLTLLFMHALRGFREVIRAPFVLC